MQLDGKTVLVTGGSRGLGGSIANACAKEGADLVITGEGCLDYQTVYNKAPVGVAAKAVSRGVPVVAIAGSLGEGFRDVHQHGIDAAAAITCAPMTLDESSERSAELLADTAEQVLRFMKTGARVFG